MRPFILHAYGGLYLDYDVECFAATDGLLEGCSLVLQSAEKGGRDITNAILASAPHHPFWLKVMALLQHRVHLAVSDSNSGSNILLSTGPRMLTEAFELYVGSERLELRDSFLGTWHTGGGRLRVYGLMEWFVPCIWNDYACHQNISQTQHDMLPRNLVGHHHCSGTWLKRIKDRNRRRTLGLILLTISLILAAISWFLYQAWIHRAWPDSALVRD